MYPATFKENFPTGLGFEWDLDGTFLKKKLLTKSKVSLESIEWLDYVQKTDSRIVDRQGKRCKIISGWNSHEVKIGKYTVDGYCEVDNKRLIFEYNGCFFHNCPFCKSDKKDEFERQTFFKNLKNSEVIEIFGCQWNKLKSEIDFTPSISPLLFDHQVHRNRFMDYLTQNKLFGFAVVDIIATSDAEKFLNLNWPPIFKKTIVKYSDLPEWMQKNAPEKSFPRETIVQSMNAKRILLHTSLIKFYLDHGFKLTKVYKMFEYEGRPCFKNVYDMVYRARVEATESNDVMKSTASKLVSNAMYGRFLLNPNKFTQTSLMTEKGYKRASKHVTFKKANRMSENIFEVTKSKTRVTEKYPIHCGHNVLHLSKLILMEFVVFLHEFLEPDAFELIYTGDNYHLDAI